MRCILTVNFSPWSRYSGGGQRSTHNLACALARRGHRVSVVYTKPPWEDVALPPDLPYEATWAALPAVRSASGAVLRPTTPFFVARRVARLLAADGGERAVVHGNGEEAALVSRLRRRERRFGFVMTPRYPSLPRVFDAPVVMNSWPGRLLVGAVATKYAWLGVALRGADTVCPTSRAAADMVQRAYLLERSKLEIVPNGISVEFLAADDAVEPQAAGAELDTFVRGGDFAIYFGRIAREKGVHTIVDALARLGTDAPRFVFAGRGPEQARLASRIAQVGLASRVHFAPWLDAKALSRVVRRAAFAVLPSFEESFGNTMAEAMAAGVAVISSTAGSIPEVVDDGVTGLLVAPGDDRALAETMRTLLGNVDRRRALAAAGQERARSRYTWDASAAQFEAVYARTLAG